MRTKQEVLDYFREQKRDPETNARLETAIALFVQLVDHLFFLIPDGPGKTVAFRKIAEARAAVLSAITHRGQ